MHDSPMHDSPLSELNSLGTSLGNSLGDPGICEAARPLLHNVVILPDGTVTWSADTWSADTWSADTWSEKIPEVIPAVDCEIVPEWYSIGLLQIPQPQPPEIFITVPEFTSTRALKMAERV
jgi:hypothetical protein